MTPHKCPVCNGRGVVEGGFYNQPPMSHEYRPTSTGPMTETCKACSGTGILWGFSYETTPSYTPWADPLDGNTTFPPFTITWENPGYNVPPNFNDGTIVMNNVG